MGHPCFLLTEGQAEDLLCMQMGHSRSLLTVMSCSLAWVYRSMAPVFQVGSFLRSVRYLGFHLECAMQLYNLRRVHQGCRSYYKTTLLAE